MNEKAQKISELASVIGDTATVSRADADKVLTDLMANAGYLRQSSALINDALQKGFDVLQLPNGDIVTTGTKTIVYQYQWDGKNQKLNKTKTSDSSRKAPKRPKVDIEEDDEEL